MHPSLAKAELLIGQNRLDLAERELRSTLSTEPEHPRALALLAMCRMRAGDHRQAEQLARQAVALEPDGWTPTFILGQIMLNADNLPAARQAADTALQIDPDHAPGYWLRGMIAMEAKRFDEALEFAEAGLARDAEDVDLQNLRSMALVRLGRRQEAEEQIGRSLRQNPDDSYTHANRGWTALHAGKPKEARDHFSEALRLDPTNEWAKGGMVEALKARNPIYRVMLAYFLMMSRLSGGLQIGIVVGGYLLYKLLHHASEANPSLQPLVMPVLVAYVCFAILSWIGPSLFNLLLRLSPYGRQALSADQVTGSTFLGIILFAAVSSLVAALATDIGWLWTLTYVLGISTLLTAGWWNRHGTPAFKWAGITVAAILGLGLVTVIAEAVRGEVGLLNVVWVLLAVVSIWSMSLVGVGKRAT